MLNLQNKVLKTTVLVIKNVKNPNNKNNNKIKNKNQNKIKNNQINKKC